MKKIIISFIFVIVMMFTTTSCGTLMFRTEDPNDSFYMETSPYYHRQHYYNDYYYDRHSNYYQKQHYYRNESPTVIIKHQRATRAIRSDGNRGNRNNGNRLNNRNNRRK